jgi:excisionase family DNA binding protein
MADDVEYLTVQEAAERLGVSRRRIWDLIREGKIDAIQNPLDRREKMIAGSELDAFMKFARPKKAVA